MIKFNHIEYNCAMELTIEIIGGKWKPLIIWYLGEKTMRFCELKRSMPHITQKMFTQQLKALEKSGLIKRVVYTEKSPKVEYSLTDIGKSLLPILLTLCEWGVNYTRSVESYDKVEAKIEL